MKRQSFLGILLLLLLAGCRGPKNYAQQLGLPALPPPRQLGSAKDVQRVGHRAGTPVVDQISKTISESKSINRIDMERSQLGLASAISVAYTDLVFKEAKAAEELRHAYAYLDQAAQIRKAQIENQDSDSSGEVASRIAAAHQHGLNCDYLLAQSAQSKKQQPQKHLAK